MSQSWKSMSSNERKFVGEVANGTGDINLLQSLLPQLSANFLSNPNVNMESAASLFLISSKRRFPAAEKIPILKLLLDNEYPLSNFNHPKLLKQVDDLQVRNFIQSVPVSGGRGQKRKRKTLLKKRSTIKRTKNRCSVSRRRRRVTKH